jgi:hypothetical protein
MSNRRRAALGEIMSLRIGSFILLIASLLAPNVDYFEASWLSGRLTVLA